MPRYKHTEAENGQGLLLSINLKEQLLPETFEYMLNEIIETKIDTGVFDKKYKNDKTGASAVPPSALLKLIIYGYSKGRKSSRGIWELNNNNIIAKALTGDMDIHWTTIADFISRNGEEFKDIFVKVLAYCNELGLIGGETFAIDGLRLPSNASLEKSGTKEQLEKRVLLYRRMAEKHQLRHRNKDARGETDGGTQKRYEKRQKHLARQIEKIDSFIQEMEQRTGNKGFELKSNVTDNESAMIQSSKGTIQGYIGIAVSDKKNQVIIGAKAAGTANEGGHLPEVLDISGNNIKEAGVKAPEEGKKPIVLGDPNYFSEENLRACAERGIEAVFPDGKEKQRENIAGGKRYEACDFIYHEAGDYYECPQGKRLEYKTAVTLGGREGKKYRARIKDCGSCPGFSNCMRGKKEKNKLKSGRELLITESNKPGNLGAKMREKLSTQEYQEKYADRIQIVEPVFANISYCKGLNRFTLRGKDKVNGQWLLYCIVHNLGKCLNELNARRNSA